MKDSKALLIEPKLNEIQGAVHTIFSKLVNMEEKGSKYIKVIEAQASELTEIRKTQEQLYICMETFDVLTERLLEQMNELKAIVDKLLKNQK